MLTRKCPFITILRDVPCTLPKCLRNNRLLKKRFPQWMQVERRLGPISYLVASLRTRSTAASKALISWHVWQWHAMFCLICGILCKNKKIKRTLLDQCKYDIMDVKKIFWSIFWLFWPPLLTCFVRVHIIGVLNEKCKRGMIWLGFFLF